MFITFEGIEGSGKSTQIKLLSEELIRRGYRVTLTREPGGTSIGDQIRKILLDSANKGMVTACEMLLYWAARAQHVEELVRPALAEGKIVLCDRFVDSTVAYQGYARGVDRSVLESLRGLVVGSLSIDKTLLFDLPVDEGLRRAKGRISKKAAGDKEDRFENEARAFHEKVRQGFLDLARREPARFTVIDSTREKSQVHAQVLAAVLDALERKGGKP